MKVYISADIEGVTGVTHWDETELSKADCNAAREQMTAEVVAACEGALQVGATEIWVKDAHDSARNLIAERLPREARLIRGWSGHPFVMLQELDKSFDGVALVGYHSRAASGGSPLAHTMSGKVHWLKINGCYASEFLMAAYTAGLVKAPLFFVSGDQALCDEIAQFNPIIRTVAVKQGVGNSTISLQPGLATALIRQSVSEALVDAAHCHIAMPAHFSVEIEYAKAYLAYQAGFFPGAVQTGPLTVQFENDDYFEVLRFLLFVL